MRAIEVLPASSWAKETAIDHVRLTFDERNRRRLRYVALGGTEFVLDLQRATVMHDGDGLKLENGQIIAVEAAPEALAEVTAPDPRTLLRLAWHIGNRHLPADLQPARILIRDDHVIVQMLEGLGATVRRLEATFTPERGAYSGATAHPVFAHDHGSHDHVE
ncbi:MAG: urease accessory protein UreE [Steroidobacteraceae bacterium]